MSDDDVLVDQVASAMAGFAMDDCGEADAAAWRANARAAIQVMRVEHRWELRDDLVRTIVDAQATIITADAVALLDAAYVIADSILDGYDVTVARGNDDDPQKETEAVSTMGTQRYLIEDLQRRGFTPEPEMFVVHAIERLRTVGDDVSGILHMWMQDSREEISTMHMALTVSDRLAEAAKDLALVVFHAGANRVT